MPDQYKISKSKLSTENVICSIIGKLEKKTQHSILNSTAYAEPLRRDFLFLLPGWRGRTPQQRSYNCPQSAGTYFPAHHQMNYHLHTEML